MEVVYQGKNLSEQERSQVWEILCECDEEFYPRLSLRNSSSQKNLLTGEQNIGSEKPTAYFEEMILQDFILAYDAGDVVGFMTFRQNYMCESLQKFGESLYITTVCVTKSLRGRGIMKEMYSYMENEVCNELRCGKISTRTWSLNEAQIHELTVRGYARLAILENDRGPGVDTIYFGREMNI